MRIVVTGGAGFIGAHAGETLALADHDVVAFDDLSTGFAENLEGTGVALVEGSILDSDGLDRVVGNADAVIHLAARPSVPKSIADPLASHQVNATGTLQVLEAVRRAGSNAHVVVASSSSVYGQNPTLPKHEALVPMPLSPYGASKLASEAYTLAHASSFGLSVLVFRFFNVFGPRQPAGHAYAAVVPAFIDAALAGRALPIEGDGKQTRDFTYVGTVASVLADAVTRRVASDGPVNLAFGTRVSLLELVALLGAVLGRELEIDFAAPRPGDVRDSQADSTQMRELFPDVQPTDLREGLEATIAWFRAQS
jgi:UDP-glucose 4-epimerase